jgi:hypothetical protein
MFKRTKKLTARQTLALSTLIATGGVFLVILAAPVAVQLNRWWYAHQHPELVARHNRIESIYDSLRLGGDYRLTGSNIFSDKRIYEWDPSRSYSSSQSFERDANVDVTYADVRAKIETAGFKFTEDPYPNAVIREAYFKSSRNEYVRLTVSSRPRDVDFRQHANSDIDPNQGPSTVLIKVNLDDNNE